MRLTTRHGKSTTQHHQLPPSQLTPPGFQVSSALASKPPSPWPGQPTSVPPLFLPGSPRLTPPPQVPVLQSSSPAQLAARILSTNLGASIRDYIFIDFCAGAGGPTPYIEKHLNQTISNGASTTTPAAAAPSTGTSYAAVAAAAPKQPVRFVLTDLHPHVADWRRAAAASPNLSFVPEPVDAADAPADLLERYKKAETGAEGAKKVFRLFNLAFHHFDDPLAKAILKNTVETSDGFG